MPGEASEERETPGSTPDRGTPRVPMLTPEVRSRLPRRDPAALQLFFDAYFERVYGYVRRLVQDEHLAEDLTQDIFLHIHRALPTYDPERDLRPWVFTIATNRIRDQWRSRAHQAGRSEIDLDEDDLPAELANWPRAAEPGLSDEELRSRLREAIDLLPEGLRMTVLLRVYEELSFEEIGRIVGRNEVAVRKRYSRALEALREALGPAWRIQIEGSR